MARFTNQAQLRYGDSVANSNIAVGEILEVLSAAKTAVRSGYQQNDEITYVISMVNSGTTGITGLTVTDNLGAYTFGTTTATTLVPLTYVADSIKYYVNGVLQPTPTVAAGDSLVISGISIPAGGNAVLVYETETNAYTPLEAAATVTNTATITGGGLTPVTVEETVTAISAPLLTINKAVSPVPVTENGRLTYTFTIQNFGSQPVTADTGAVITDTFDPILSDLTVAFNDTAWTAATNYTYDATTGSFATVAGQITVPAATYTQNPTTGAWSVTPGVSTLTVTGTV